MCSIGANKSKGSLIERPTLGRCEVTQDSLCCLAIELQYKLHNALNVLSRIDCTDLLERIGENDKRT